MKPVAIRNQSELQQHLTEGVGLVDFCVPWSAPCREQQRVLTRLTSRFQGRAKIGVMNVEENEELARAFGIESVPTLVLFQHLREVQRFVGLHSAADLTDALEKIVGEPN